MSSRRSERDNYSSSRRRSRSPPRRRDYDHDSRRPRERSRERDYSRREQDRRPPTRDERRDRVERYDRKDSREERTSTREDRHHSTRRSRSPIPAPRGERRSPPPPPRDASSSNVDSRNPSPPLSHEKGELEEDQDDAAMQAMMGFSGFGSTHGQHVAGNTEKGSVSVSKSRKYRQYMNRKGGFNRPLDKME